MKEREDVGEITGDGGGAGVSGGAWEGKGIEGIFFNAGIENRSTGIRDSGRGIFITTRAWACSTINQ